MPELELRHLRVICTVVDAGSLSRAAAQLGVSQPALTAQLQRIERQLGGRLFERTREGVTPTELGDFVVSSARVVLADMTHLIDGAMERIAPRRGAGPVRLGGSAGPLVPLFATRLRLRLDLPEIGTEMEAAGRSLLKMVETGHVDFAILESYRDVPVRIPDTLRARLLVVEPAFVAVPEGSSFGESAELSLADLSAEEWLTDPPGESAEQLALQRAAAGAGFAPRIRHHTVDTTSARELVRAGALSLAHPASRQGDGVTVRPLAGSPLLIHQLLVWDPEGPLAGQVDVAYRCAAEAYLTLVSRSEMFREWWDDHPEAHVDFDAALKD